MSGSPSLEPNKLTWTVLLGRWVEFAKSALALPDDEEGRVLRESVPDIIMLQAVWFALQHLDEVRSDQRAVGIDRAELLIDKHSQALTARWHHQVMPPMLHELIADARQQLQAVADVG